MTQYVRIVSCKWRSSRSLGTILKIKAIYNYSGIVTVIEINEKYTDSYTKDEVEFIPEEISNSSLFKLILDEQNLEWYNELKKGGKMKLTKKDKREIPPAPKPKLNSLSGKTKTCKVLSNWS